MKVAAGIATMAAHGLVFVGMGLIDPPPEPERPPLDITTIELVELPAPEPAALPEPAPPPEPTAPEPEPEPEPAAPEPPPPPKPKPAPLPAPIPAAPPNPTPSPTTAAVPASPSDEPTDPAPSAPAAGPRKLGGRLSNKRGGKAAQQRSAAKRCPEPPSKPKPTHKVSPTFSAATRSSVAGSLVLRARIDARGIVTSVQVVESPDDAAAKAAKAAFAQWTFEPAVACGKAVPSSYAKRWTFSGGR